MIEQQIEYVDYNGKKHKDTWFFHLNAVEAIEMEVMTKVGLEALAARAVAENDPSLLFPIYKEAILKSVGRKSSDGLRFEKSPEIRAGFEQTEAFSVLFVMLIKDPDAGGAFLRALSAIPEAK